ncbi:Gfo/Idh/MocA family protein [Armatimonas sp.]|uniref:Gfo/Idh/MocA family protein n=1 Tax=Armatimonas sp. TaxID=1872638 RepID=UPI00375082FC
MEFNRIQGANNRIVLGLIGCGGMGAANMRNLMDKQGVEVAALCDVDTGRMGGDIAEVEKKYGRKPEIFRDYRKMLERKDIDAIIVGTPDHWHALNLIHTVESGKDAYCEKPISHNLVEARTMAKAVAYHKKIVQVGTWQRSGKEFTDAISFVRNNKLGSKIVLVRAWRTDGSKVGNEKPSAPPASLDYDRWIGPAAMVPYAGNHVHGNWRWFLNTGTGMTGDWGVHMLDIALLGMSATNQDLVMPVSVSAVGGKLAYPTDDRTAPDTIEAIFKFKNPDFVMQWSTGRDYPDKPDCGVEFVSADGKFVRVWRGGWSVHAPGGELIPKEGSPAVGDHWQNWLDGVRTRTQTRSSLASMAQTTAVCHLANIAYLCGETVHFDKATMDLVGKTGRDTTSYWREYRKPWKLPVYK